MEKSPQDVSQSIEIARFKFALIAPVVSGTFPDASRNAYYRRVTEKPLSFPDGSVRSLSPKTIQKWYSGYQQYGIDGLMPKERSDKGTTRALSDAAIQEIWRLKEKLPRINATQIHRKLVEDGFIPGSVSVCAVQRFIKRNDLKTPRPVNAKDRRAFEEDAFGRLWQADTYEAGEITENGKTQTVYIIAVIDDHSRVLVGAQAFYHDNAANFQIVLKQAVASYGRPERLYVDNGSPYANKQLSLICVSIGTVLIHTKVKDPQAKGKVERLNESIQTEFIDTIDLKDYHSLKEFNADLADFVCKYNRTPHKGINKEKPLDRWRRTGQDMRAPDSPEWLDECFMNRISRKVRKDSTVSIDNVCYDVPCQFAGLSVEIRYLPGDMSSAYILYEGKHYPIRRTDRVANCHTKRNSSKDSGVPTIDYSKMGGEK